ncbi:MAG: methylglyoxal synthase [Candidatus Promineifilaceae bacterium]|jgi:methylglyoxal synthase
MESDVLPPRKRIALVAHDNRKDELLEWVRENSEKLAGHELYGTGTTGWLLQQELGLEVNKFQSGPLGGDQQLGARISERGIDVMVFFWDPLEAQPHDPDVKALLRIAVLWNIPVASNRSTADFLFTSPYMAGEYERLLTDFENYRKRLDWRLSDQAKHILQDRKAE